MNKEDILAFCTLASCLSFTKAAERLYITQSSLSKKILRLENELGVKLLFRNRHTVRLTSAGLVLFRESDALLSSMEQLQADIRRAASEKLLHLRVAILGTGLGRLFLERLKVFEKSHEEICVDYSFMSFHEIYYALDTLKIDAALTSDLGLSTIPGIEMKKLGKSSNVLVLPADAPFLKKKDFSLLKYENFFALSTKSSDRGMEMVKTFSGRWGFHPKSIKEIEAIDEILFMVQAGKGISILPSFDLPKENPHLFYLPLSDRELDTPVVLAWNEKNKNQAVRVFSDFVMSSQWSVVSEQG